MMKELRKYFLKQIKKMNIYQGLNIGDIVQIDQQNIDALDYFTKKNLLYIIKKSKGKKPIIVDIDGNDVYVNYDENKSLMDDVKIPKSMIK